ncbi:hypothetical protein CYMTET_20716 [Cymbomonas tetramitiformis]|uniref:Uncharacterized protein n=1 Tax=Cymbomonas tetramitiformis TaxID=36881 RepID=A0AAE0G3G1_9CHLO|nr:hypothetical protein CYMTET_20716 [Cymbomonas tetramitiformis]
MLSFEEVQAWLTQDVASREDPLPTLRLILGEAAPVLELLPCWAALVEPARASATMKSLATIGDIKACFPHLKRIKKIPTDGGMRRRCFAICSTRRQAGNSPLKLPC